MVGRQDKYGFVSLADVKVCSYSPSKPTCMIYGIMIRREPGFPITSTDILSIE
jgi:hypothetical protein